MVQQVVRLPVRPPAERGAFTIPEFIARKIHGITPARAHRYGRPLNEVMRRFADAFGAAADGTPAVQAVVGHNLLEFDREILIPELGICGLEFPDDVEYADTLAMGWWYFREHRGTYKLPDVHEGLFAAPLKRPGGRHNVVDDVRACARIYFALLARAASDAATGRVRDAQDTHTGPSLPVERAHTGAFTRGGARRPGTFRT